ncbi:MAG: response regulator [bacterium]
MRNGKHVVLCVDDDRDYLDILKVLVTSGDYIVETASSAAEGLKEFKAAKPDLLLVDLMMEEIDAGVSLVREIRACGSNVPVFLLSSVGDNLNIIADYSTLGLSGVLQKPVDRELLLSILKAKLKQGVQSR